MTTLTFPIFGFFNVEIRVTARNAAASGASAGLETARRELLDKIENGFAIEGSDARAEVPGFAKASLKAQVEVDC